MAKINSKRDLTTAFTHTNEKPETQGPMPREKSFPIPGLSREEFFMVFSAFLARGNNPDTAYKLTKQYMPDIIKKIEA